MAFARWQPALRGDGDVSIRVSGDELHRAALLPAREVVATALPDDIEYVRTLSAHAVINVRTTAFESAVKDIDVVVGTVGGDAQARSFAILKRGGVLVSSVAVPDEEIAARHGVRGVFFLIKVTTEGLARIGQMIDDGQLATSVGEVLPLSDARIAPRNARRAHKRGKIVLGVGAGYER